MGCTPQSLNALRRLFARGRPGLCRLMRDVAPVSSPHVWRAYRDGGLLGVTTCRMSRYNWGSSFRCNGIVSGFSALASGCPGCGDLFVDPVCQYAGKRIARCREPKDAMTRTVLACDPLRAQCATMWQRSGAVTAWPGPGMILQSGLTDWPRRVAVGATLVDLEQWHAETCLYRGGCVGAPVSDRG